MQAKINNIACFLRKKCQNRIRVYKLYCMVSTLRVLYCLLQNHVITQTTPYMFHHMLLPMNTGHPRSMSVYEDVTLWVEPGLVLGPTLPGPITPKIGGDSMCLYNTIKE